MLTYCALISDYRFMNGALTDEQSSLMFDDIEKWSRIQVRTHISQPA
jgi:hypothetical protein